MISRLRFALNSQLRSTLERHATSFSTSSRPLVVNRYRRFGDPPPQNEPVDPWQIIEKLPPGRARRGRGGGGGGGSRFADIKYRATTLLRQPVVVVLIAGGTTYYVYHLERVDETGRWRFMDVSPDVERQVAQQTLDEVLGEYGSRVLPRSDPTSRMVERVVDRIVRANELDRDRNGDTVDWKVHVVKDDNTRNAFVIPGGKIFVFSGILPVAKDEDGLAVILGHEIAHQVARHSAERLSSMKVLVALSYLLTTTLGIDLGLSQVLLNLVMTLPNSRQNESEADLIGLRLANSACFDILTAEQLWQRMDEGGGESRRGGPSLDFLSTHPSSANRSVKVREWAQEVLKERPEKCPPIVRDNVDAFRASVVWRIWINASPVSSSPLVHPTQVMLSRTGTRTLLAALSPAPRASFSASAAYFGSTPSRPSTSTAATTTTTPTKKSTKKSSVLAGQLLDILEEASTQSTPEQGPDQSSILQHLKPGQVTSPQHLSPRHLLTPYLARPNFALAYPLGPPTEFRHTHDPFARYGLDPLRDVSSLNPFWKAEFCTTMGKIKPRGKTGLQRKSQRRVGKSIRRARSMGLVPTFGVSVPGQGGERY
ncbi:hypothetical protein JCM3766R1_004850 [Sporobolomyces carnicolor]